MLPATEFQPMKTLRNLHTRRLADINLSRDGAAFFRKSNLSGKRGEIGAGWEASAGSVAAVPNPLRPRAFGGKGV